MAENKKTLQNEVFFYYSSFWVLAISAAKASFADLTSASSVSVAASSVATASSVAVPSAF